MILNEVVHPRPWVRVLIRLVLAGPSAPVSTAREPNNLAGKSLGVAQPDQMPDGIMAASWA